ncbi:unnamed protein product [Schistosoma rodhaini]|nr:unnamed protein product [Schistosoma rodhaini]
MESSTAFSLCVILRDAVKEFKKLANVVDIMRKKKQKNNLSYSEAEEFVVKQMNKILEKYSFKYSASFQDMHAEVLKELQKSPKITEYPSTATVIEDSVFSTKYMEKLMKEIFCLIGVFEKLAEEIQNTGSYDTLQQSVDKEESEFKEIEHILESTEERVHAEITSYLNDRISYLRKYKEYEAVVRSDRIEKEKARQREEQEELEIFADCNIQNWWRTVCVQHNLGPYGKKKRKGKGSKTKKGKGKKK